MAGPEVITMGCRLNIAESAVIEEKLAGHDNIIVVNSCAVTNEAVRQTRQAIRKAKKNAPDKKIIVTGCAAQIDPEQFAKMREVDQIFGNAEKLNLDRFLGEDIRRNSKIIVDDIMQLTETAPHFSTIFAEKSRGFVEIQNGCDHRCTFCIIPYGRGNSRSIPAGILVDRIKSLCQNNINEIILTGVDVTSYGQDLPGRPSLGNLVERILKLVPNLPRLRLSSIDGIEIDDHLFDLLTNEPRLMPHVHLSLQSGDDMILKRMKRRHNFAQAVDIVEKLQSKRPEITIGADIIAGFPTEDNEMFQNSVKMVRECHIVHGHIFPYSPKKGTPAAKMPQVEGQLIKQRAKILRDEVAKQKEAWQHGLIGSNQRILVESSGHIGHAENFAMVKMAKKMLAGSLVNVHITHIENGQLCGEQI
ncbi:tRNA (N(6)-L-threonylcarbamoyladenosine(37)-C(2))-methylthiotransferase MtaB [Sphingorhabdus lutea]|uniref:tRNA (N(6)-L-threonylcarbamoyladenosine(37)-C(2))-methylthiotransferase n=1 Tax=Sphingorhabdus lutea TaxID=1913578 RepID=A0A1L3JCD5_9SPHN|nr:tRNA (N(6)-L-threonylcarbamoyladenosine(37)-C(2))-methylthiotransferase MtaB [Sphingorhabdus lutea]APG62782.1 tRNA (N(6)-L-threonylcarbamoyladenosine(37)-C(2))-methylthiotransferase MtaB [Sphingorhabdus lutea]